MASRAPVLPLLYQIRLVIWYIRSVRQKTNKTPYRRRQQYAAFGRAGGLGRVRWLDIERPGIRGLC